MIRTAELVPSLALGAALLFHAAVALAEDPSVIQISAVLASKEPRPNDPRLDSLKQDLESLPYAGYTLLDINSCRFQSGDQCGMDIPGGGYLQIRTTEATPTGTIILSIKAPTPATAIGGMERELVAREAKPGGRQ
jgi:hypothetical protein